MSEQGKPINPGATFLRPDGSGRPSFERFTDRARKVLQLANQEAQRFDHDKVDTHHVLLGLVKEGSGVAANVLKNLDVDLRMIRIEVEALIGTGPERVIMGRLPYTKDVDAVLLQACKEAADLGHSYVGTEHLLLGLVAGRAEGGYHLAHQVLARLGVSHEQVGDEVLLLLGQGKGATDEERAAKLALEGIAPELLAALKSEIVAEVLAQLKTGEEAAHPLIRVEIPPGKPLTEKEREELAAGFKELENAPLQTLAGVEKINDLPHGGKLAESSTIIANVRAILALNLEPSEALRRIERLMWEIKP